MTASTWRVRVAVAGVPDKQRLSGTVALLAINIRHFGSCSLTVAALIRRPYSPFPTSYSLLVSTLFAVIPSERSDEGPALCFSFLAPSRSRL